MDFSWPPAKKNVLSAVGFKLYSMHKLPLFVSVFYFHSIYSLFDLNKLLNGSVFGVGSV